jgi:hypothetical protein
LKDKSKLGRMEELTEQQLHNLAMEIVGKTNGRRRV